MAETPIRFEDGAAYEEMMGVWSRIAGEVFLDWLAPSPGQTWIDLGCGNGASTAMIVDRCAPSEIQGVDPSEAQLAYARKRLAGGVAHFRQGEGAALPFADGAFDVGVMALVIFFLPDPAKGVSELARVVRPGGVVATYAWDMLGGGFTLEPIYIELRKLGVAPPMPPRSDAARIEALRDLWIATGLEAVEARDIAVRRTFPDFEAYWTSSLKGPAAAAFAAMAPETLAQVKHNVRMSLSADASGRVICAARANAVKGKKRA